MPDEGKIEWAKKVRVGYLDQHTALEKGMTIGSVLSSAFDFLYDMEKEMNDIYARLGDVDEDEMNKLMEEAGTIQDMLTMHDFYMIDAKVEDCLLYTSTLLMDMIIRLSSSSRRGRDKSHEKNGKKSAK